MAVNTLQRVFHHHHPFRDQTNRADANEDKESNDSHPLSNISLYLCSPLDESKNNNNDDDDGDDDWIES